MDGAVRHRRGSHLPRHHRRREVLRGRAGPGQRPVHLAGWARHLGRGLVRGGGRLYRRPTAGGEVRRAGRRAGAGHRARPGRRTLRQLVQPGAVRPPHRPPLGTGDLPRAPAGGLWVLRDLPPDVPLRVAVERRGRGPGDLGGPPLPARPRTRVRGLRRGVLHGAGVDRDAAHRPGGCRRRPGSEAERLDLDRGVRVRGRLLRLVRAPPSWPGAVGATRRRSGGRGRDVTDTVEP